MFCRLDCSLWEFVRRATLQNKLLLDSVQRTRAPAQQNCWHTPVKMPRSRTEYITASFCDLAFQPPIANQV
eukprot:943326-Amphidinium_carterae.1